MLLLTFAAWLRFDGLSRRFHFPFLSHTVDLYSGKRLTISGYVARDVAHVTQPARCLLLVLEQKSLLLLRRAVG